MPPVTCVTTCIPASYFDFRLFWRVEEIVRRIRYPQFLSGMPRIAARSRRLSALGINPLNAARARKHATAFVTHNIHQEPGNRIRVRRRRIRYRFAFNTAAVIRFPRWPGKMLSERFSILINQLRTRSLQSPRILRNSFLADVHLVALSMHLQKKLLTGRRLNLLRDLLPANCKCGQHVGCADQRTQRESAKGFAHDSIPPVSAGSAANPQYSATPPAKPRTK